MDMMKLSSGKKECCALKGMSVVFRVGNLQVVANDGIRKQVQKNI
jgi:hypothetical protein